MREGCPPEVSKVTELRSQKMTFSIPGKWIKNNTISRAVKTILVTVRSAADHSLSGGTDRSGAQQ